MPAEPAAIARIQAADARLAKLAIAAKDRPAVRAAMIAEMEAEVCQATDAATAASDAEAERGRIGAVIMAGRHAGKTRQALILALASPISADAARTVLSGLPADNRAEPAALIMPDSVPPFGTPAAQAERLRIAAILRHAEAGDRIEAAADLALDPTMTAEGAGAVLALLPRAPLARLSATPLADRAAGLAEFGPGSGEAHTSTAERSRETWSRAVAAANRSIGAAAPTAAAPTMPRSMADHPHFGLTDAARAALTEVQK